MWKTVESRDQMQELRKAFVETLTELMNEDEKIVALEADLGTASGFSAIRESHPEQFIEMGIAEANMIGVAAGMSLRGFTPYVHTFAPFASRRVADQVFLSGAYSGNTMNIYGSDPGVCAAANGGTHTTFEDIAFYRAVPNVCVFDPADATQLKWLIRELSNKKGIHYIRGNRKGVPTIYKEGSTFEIGKGNIIHKGEKVLLISMGEVLSTALEAAEELEDEGLSVEVIDMFTVKPLDKALILQEIEGKEAVITFENHSIYNGLGSAVAEVLAENRYEGAFKRIGVEDHFGEVGSLNYLKERFGLTKEHVKQVVMECQEG